MQELERDARAGDAASAGRYRDSQSWLFGTFVTLLESHQGQSCPPDDGVISREQSTATPAPVAAPAKLEFPKPPSKPKYGVCLPVSTSRG